MFSIGLALVDAVTKAMPKPMDPTPASTIGHCLPNRARRRRATTKLRRSTEECPHAEGHAGIVVPQLAHHPAEVSASEEAQTRESTAQRVRGHAGGEHHAALGGPLL